MKLVNRPILLAFFCTLLFVGLPKREAHAGFLLTGATAKSPNLAGLILLTTAVGGSILCLSGQVLAGGLTFMLDKEVSQDELETRLLQRYGHLTSNQQVIADLAALIVESINNENCPTSEMQEVKIDKTKILRALGSAAADRELATMVITDLS